MIEILWTDGTVDRAESWSALEDRVRRSQRLHVEPSRREFRRLLRQRAYVWSGERLRTFGRSSRELFADLERLGMIRIVEPVCFGMLDESAAVDADGELRCRHGQTHEHRVDR